MGQADYFKPRDFNRICDRCGRKVKASETFKERAGWIVCGDCHDSRHRWLLPRTRTVRLNINDPRPDTPPVFVEPGEITAEDL
jgi:hypothetical protein